MIGRICFLFIVFGVGQGRYNGSRRPSINLKFLELLPEHMTNAFLGSLFNSSLTNILKIADKFQFCDADVREMRFLVFLKNQTEPAEISLENPNIDLNLQIKVLIHGWFGTGNNDFIKNLANQYHRRGNFNVIGVDWSRHSRKDYITSTCTARDVGKAITEFILSLTRGDTRILSNVHLIGHSLGAQVAAFAGKDMLNKTGRKIGRITGLDAAAPLFEFPIKVPKHLRIDVDDADYVDGIHTNMGFFGFASPFGSADFFVENGSPIQPGCNTNNFFEDLVCSHGRAVDLFQESIISPNLIGQECSNPFVYRIGLCSRRKRAIMGEDSSRMTRGSYFLETYGRPPYGKG